ncbi:hypothetical protein SAMN04490243_0937 [Robiginitalea myxolifaciens]|uniref:Uncharacterized protein n=1 Tax=Robiginitalea myxolifaciens TaxID=400055 RepID=A0A1I6FYT2_9FLAO|nr:hypothetical protein [Robiginitalea myxolifaciens]SFR35099.1 hypothetical protein SAMN04490243_0937 [Robiginitalea myxolifaciens]
MKTIEERIDQMGALTRLIRWTPKGLIPGKPGEVSHEDGKAPTGQIKGG